jgi:magnesium-transporting ATPase (P-type)
MNSRKDTFMNCELAQDTINLVRSSILYNCSAQVEMIDTQYVPTGNGTEVGLLKFLQDADIPVHLLIQNKLGHIKAHIPFSSDSKYSACAVANPDSNSICIYLKGAPEVILALCQQTLTEGGIQGLNDLTADRSLSLG